MCVLYVSIGSKVRPRIFGYVAMCLCLDCSGVCGVGGSGSMAWARVWEGGLLLYMCVL